MKTIIPAAQQAAMVLGKQKRREGVTYRLFKYVMLEPVEEGVLLYNTMTLELLLLSSQEADTMMESEELLTKWFLVPQEHNDRKLADDLRAFVKAMYKPSKYITHYKVYTTTHCNARCYYCFEKNFTNKKTMSSETAGQLVKYIAENCGGNEVSIEWFGGEPLVNQKAIDIVCRGLTDAGVSFHSVMISNGYLLNEANIGKAKDLWRIKLVQITLDGTEEIYNRIKDYVDPQGSPFLRVMKNVEALLDAGICVRIAMNVTEENCRDLLLLADQLAEQFGGRKGFQVACAAVADTAAYKPGQTVGTMTTSNDAVKNFLILQKRLTELGVYYPGKLSVSVRAIACAADNSSAVVVLPDGSLGLCGSIAEGETFGSIFSPERDIAMINSWKERILLTDPICDDCLYYPLCIRLKKCPEEACNELLRDLEEKITRIRIVHVYRLYRQQKDC